MLFFSAIGLTIVGAIVVGYLVMRTVEYFNDRNIG